MRSFDLLHRTSFLNITAETGTLASELAGPGTMLKSIARGQILVSSLNSLNPRFCRFAPVSTRRWCQSSLAQNGYCCSKVRIILPGGTKCAHAPAGEAVAALGATSQDSLRLILKVRGGTGIGFDTKRNPAPHRGPLHFPTQALSRSGVEGMFSALGQRVSSWEMPPPMKLTNFAPQAPLEGEPDVPSRLCSLEIAMSLLEQGREKIGLILYVLFPSRLSTSTVSVYVC
mmetsp:Transcript_12077/g.22927  ORF Transcript_12077/g.22927 Transcript_12077/m.22927 type:complete len:229 (-) Transcript_12077:83-769(-)